MFRALDHLIVRMISNPDKGLVVNDIIKMWTIIEDKFIFKDLNDIRNFLNKKEKFQLTKEKKEWFNFYFNFCKYSEWEIILFFS